MVYKRALMWYNFKWIILQTEVNSCKFLSLA